MAMQQSRYSRSLGQANSIVPQGVEVHSGEGSGTFVRFPEGTSHADIQRVVNDVNGVMGDAESEGVAGYTDGRYDDVDNYVFPQDDNEDMDDYAPEEMNDAPEPIPGFQLDGVPPEASTTGDVNNRPAAVQERIQIHPQIDDDDDDPDYGQALDQANNIVPRGVEVHSGDPGGTYIRFPEGTPHAEMQRVVDQVARIMRDVEPEGVAGYTEGIEEDYENYILPQDEDTEDQDDYTQEDMDDYAPEDMDDYGQEDLGSTSPIPGFQLDNVPPKSGGDDESLQIEIDLYKDAQDRERNVKHTERAQDRAQEYQGVPQEPAYYPRGGRGRIRVLVSVAITFRAASVSGSSSIRIQDLSAVGAMLMDSPGTISPVASLARLAPPMITHIHKAWSAVAPRAEDTKTIGDRGHVWKQRRGLQLFQILDLFQVELPDW